METMIERVGMPLDGFIREYDRAPFELINGERKPIMPGVSGHIYVIRLLFLLLYTHTAQNRLGEVFPEATFILPNSYDSNWVKGSRVPDVSFFVAERIAAYIAQTPEWKERPFALVPDMVVEVVSPDDHYSDIDEKVDIYLADGVRLIWVIDPQRRKATVHTPDSDQPLHLKGDAVLNGRDVIPGFEIPLPKLFE